MNFIKNLNMKKIYIILALLIVVVLLINISIVLINNNNKNKEYSDAVSFLQQSIIKGNSVDSIDTYYSIKNTLVNDGDSLKKVKQSVNERFLIFIRNISTSGIARQDDLQISSYFFEYITDKSINSAFDTLYEDYINEKINYKNYLLSLASISTISNKKIDVSLAQKTASEIKDSRALYLEGMNYYNNASYKEAIDSFNKVIPTDYTYYDKAQQLIESCISLLKEQILDKSASLANQGFYLQASKYLTQYSTIFKDDEDINYYIKYYKSLEPELVVYDGPIYHVFFHSLIIYPELAFDGDYEDQGYYKYMTTTLEFKRMLDKFYSNNYILININSLIDTTMENNITHIKKSTLMLPKGKKPLIISIDDLSYYSYMRGDGFAQKLVLDDNNEVATLVRTPDNDLVVTRDGDLVPILDDFVKTHPDFSFKDAKGIIALTGYEGILGYETQLTESDNYKSECDKAKVIINKLKETGWLFANHSYTHNNYFKDLSVTMEQLQYDTEKWEAQVGILVGKTNIYISPFGYIFDKDDKHFKYITEKKGYYIYCPVGGGGSIYYHDTSLVMYRINLDGKTLKINSHLTKPFFDAKDIIDERRPEYIW